VEVIIPAAGFGTRLRPQTWSRPKPLVSVAGKPILAHVLDRIAALQPTRVVFITGYLGDQIRAYVEQRYDFEAAFVHQAEMKGQADAINLARNQIYGPVLIAFADTIFDADFSILSQIAADGVIYVKEVENPHAFGIVELEGRHIRRIIEKPAFPPTNLAVAGVYYFPNPALLFASIERLMATNTRLLGEYYLADAIQLMIDDGARIESATMDLWRDCGRPEPLLETNRLLLSQTACDTAPRAFSNSVIIPPVVIASSARIERAVVGPYVSIGERVTITDAVVRDAIINDEAAIANVMLTHSIVGARTLVQGDFHRINLGDESELSVGDKRWEESMLRGTSSSRPRHAVLSVSTARSSEVRNATRLRGTGVICP
jgi:glucose-1-phosphate thymidylyltransferase